MFVLFGNSRHACGGKRERAVNGAVSKVTCLGKTPKMSGIMIPISKFWSVLEEALK